MFLRILLLTIVSLSVHAGKLDDGKPYKEAEPVNFCLNPQDAIDNETLASKHPEDQQLIKLVALRAGLCELISKGIVKLEFAIDLFNFEHKQNIMKRMQEERESTPAIGV
jgi:hypothetical protein